MQTDTHIEMFHHIIASLWSLQTHRNEFL